MTQANYNFSQLIPQCEMQSPNGTIKIIIDNNLNIYLPNFNLIIIKNYSPFSLGSIHNIFDMETTLVYNSKNTDDMAKVNNIQSFISTISKISSNDERNKMNNTLFNNLFEFLDYDNKLDKVKKNIIYIDTLMKQGNSKPLTDELIINNLKKENDELKLKYENTKSELDKYTNIIVPDMTPEQMKCKIRNLENTILTLENDLSTYKGEIVVYREYYDTRQKEILKLQETNINLTEIISKNEIDMQNLIRETTNMKVMKSTIETLNKQIKDIENIREEENIKFQNKIIELNAVINKLELDKTVQNKKLTKIDEFEIELEKMKQINILNNDKVTKLNEIILKNQTEKQSIISKSVLLNERIVELEKQNKSQNEMEKNLKLIQDDLNRKIIFLENIIREKETEISIIKENKISSLEYVGKKGEYENILYTQIKEIESENNKLKQIISQKDNEIKLEKKKYIKMKDNIKSLFYNEKVEKHSESESEEEFYD